MDDSISQEDREALRRKLRDKIKGKRNGGKSEGPELTRRLKDDPATLMLSMGIDDPQLLGNAKSMVKNPQAALRDLSVQLADAQASSRGPSIAHSQKITPPEGEVSEDEEAPPEA